MWQSKSDSESSSSEAAESCESAFEDTEDQLVREAQKAQRSFPSRLDAGKRRATDSESRSASITSDDDSDQLAEERACDRACRTGRRKNPLAKKTRGMGFAISPGPKAAIDRVKGARKELQELHRDTSASAGPSTRQSSEVAAAAAAAVGAQDSSPPTRQVHQLSVTTLPIDNDKLLEVLDGTLPWPFA